MKTIKLVLAGIAAFFAGLISLYVWEYLHPYYHEMGKAD
jgi:hypothetical protein